MTDDTTPLWQQVRDLATEHTLAVQQVQDLDEANEENRHTLALVLNALDGELAADETTAQAIWRIRGELTKSYAENIALEATCSDLRAEVDRLTRELDEAREKASVLTDERDVHPLVHLSEQILARVARLEAAQAEAQTDENVVEQAARVMAVRWGSGAEAWPIYADDARALHAAGLLRGEG